MPARLAQHLISKGLLPAQAVEDAQKRRAAQSGALDSALLELGSIAEPGMLQALADVSGLRPVNLADFEPNTDMSRFVPANVAERLGAVPLSLEEGTLHVACCYPPPLKDLEEVAALLGKRLETWVAIEARVRDWICALYGTAPSPRFATLIAQLDPSRAPAQPPAPTAAAKKPAPRDDGLGPISVNEPSLEDALTREMVEQIARAVAEEPILLEVRKKPRPPEPAPSIAQAPPPEQETKVADLATLQKGIAASQPTEPLEVPDELPARATHATQETRPFDLAELAQKAKESVPPTWERQSTVVALNLEALAKKSLTLDELPASSASAQAGIAAAPEIAPVSAPPVPSFEVEPKHVPEFPPVVVFPDPAPEPSIEVEGRSGPTVPLPVPLSEEVPEWTLQQARAELAEASCDRDRIIEVALRFARRTFELAAAFAVVRGAAVGWNALGEGAEALRKSPPSIPLDAPSVFRTVAMTRGSYVGPVPQDQNTAAYLEQLGRSPRTLFLFPVEVKGRLVCLIYGDPGSHAVSHRRLSELLLLCQDLPAAFGEFILSRKQRYGASAQSALSLEEVAPAAASVGWSPSASGAQVGVGRSASLAPMLTDDSARPPPDFGPILKKLTGPDAAARASAMAEFARAPGAAANALVSAFPGPTAWSRSPVGEVPDADELGPIPGALARLGRAGAQALAPLLDADDPDVRYYALLTAGSLHYPELVGGVLRGLFDFEPDISSAARAAAAALRKLPRFQDSLPDLRRELAAVDGLRRSLAARALGVLRDRDAIEGLINLTGSDDDLSAQAAAEALQEITKMTFGPDQRRWSGWWAENRGRTRAQWLVSALRHAELDVRMSAIEELSRALNDHLGFVAEADAQDREHAVRRWESEAQQNPRLRRLE